MRNPRARADTGKLVLAGVLRALFKQLPAHLGRQDLRYRVAMKVRDPKSAGPEPLGRADVNQTRVHRPTLVYNPLEMFNA